MGCSPLPKCPIIRDRIPILPARNRSITAVVAAVVAMRYNDGTNTLTKARVKRR